MDGPGIRRSAMRLAVPLVAVALLAAACTGSQKPASVGETAAAPSASPAKTVVPPATPAGAQFRWLTAELARLPTRRCAPTSTRPSWPRSARPR